MKKGLVIMVNRRDFLKNAGLSAGAMLVAGCAAGVASKAGGKINRPNILWITCEDISPWLGCYGDDFADSGNIDALAARGVRYLNAYATAPVCAPARSCLITGVYATSLGTQHLRSSVKLPAHIKCFTQYLRKAGYYCTNNYKKDYNFKDVNAWDESSKTAHWRKRKADQPFFSVFNFTTTHQGQINGADEQFHAKYGHKLTPRRRHDPAKVNLPPYYPDSPMIRKIFARYYDLIALMDRQVADILKQLETDRLAENTIVFFYSDHGTGIPRHKRVLYDTGLQVPMIIHFPKKYEHLAPVRAGETTDRLVSFADFAPTILSILGLPIPDYMQGSAFLGPQAARPRKYIYGASSRVDEAYEMSRCVRDKRYKYIRNYLPHLPLIQPSAYPDKAEIMQELRRLAAKGGLTKDQQALWAPKPAEELYDTHTDPLELNNLIDSPKHRKILTRLRGALRQWMIDIKDIGLLSEAEMLLRATEATPYEIARQPGKFPIRRILSAAELVASDQTDMDTLQRSLKDTDAGVRYWAVIAATQLDQSPSLVRAIQALLKDPYPNVRFAAAGLLAEWTGSSDALSVLVEGLDDPHGPSALYAARELELLEKKAAGVCEKIKKARQANASSKRHKDYKMFIDWALTGLLRSCGVEADHLMKF